MSQQFDVFLCHNSQDKPEVIQIAEKLQQEGLKPWLDVWELPPGQSWQERIEEQIKDIRSAAVFVGSSGLGPWQEREIRAFLVEFVARKCPVIPVLLADAPQKPDIPIFLKINTWVDFRKSEPNPMSQLIWGITGKKPSKSGLESQQSLPKLSWAERLKKEGLELELAARIKDYEAVSAKHRREGNPAEKNSLKAQMEELLADIERIEQELE